MTRASELYFEEIGENFDQYMSGYDVARRAVLIDGLIGDDYPRGNALEVGCGTGALTKLLTRSGLSVTVGDISAKLALATGEKFGVRHQAVDACAITFPDQTFDVVMSSEVIEHTPDPRKALREMARVLKPGGILVVTSPNKLWFPILWLSMKLGVRKFYGNENWLWPAVAANELRVQGMVVEKMSGCHSFPWQIPFAKMLLPALDKLGPLLWPLMINYGIRARKA